ncbi:hypothetical protein [Streptomyces phaeoluteigriseus]
MTDRWEAESAANAIPGLHISAFGPGICCNSPAPARPPIEARPGWNRIMDDHVG